MDLPTTLFDLLQRASEPLTAAQLAKQLPAKASPKAVKAALDDLAVAGKAMAFTQGRSTAYSTHSPADLCVASLAQQLPLLTTATTTAKLKAGTPKGLRPWFDEALGRLIVQGQAYWLPKGKTRLVLQRPVRPSDVLSTTAVNQLKKVLAEANRHRREPRKISDLIAWLDGDSAPTPPPLTTTSTPLSPELLRKWYDMDRALSSSSMIPIPHTWKHYETWASSQGMHADIVGFRDALESLYNAGSAMLEPCERPQDLPEHERHLQVPLSMGPPGYYWSPMV